jgi:DNA-binding NtrC family response regulator
MYDSCNVLIVSNRLENRRALTRILDGLPVSIVTSSTLRQAQEVLAKQEVNIVFCDDVLPYGTYRDLLSMPSIAKPCVVVTAHTSEPGDRYEAMVQGAFDVLRSPPEPTDIELVLIRAARHLRRQNEPQVHWPGSSRIETKAPVASIRTGQS